METKKSLAYLKAKKKVETRYCLGHRFGVARPVRFLCYECE